MRKHFVGRPRGCCRRRSGTAPGLEASQELARHPLGAAHAEVKRVLLFCVTSSRGLCGGYNAKIIQAARARMEVLRKEGTEPLLGVMGRKGLAYFRFHNQPVAIPVARLDENIPFARVDEIVTQIVSTASRRRSSTRWSLFRRGTRRSAVQEVRIEPLLPFTAGHCRRGARGPGGTDPGAGRQAAVPRGAGSAARVWPSSCRSW